MNNEDKLNRNTCFLDREVWLFLLWNDLFVERLNESKDADPNDSMDRSLDSWR